MNWQRSKGFSKVNPGTVPTIQSYKIEIGILKEKCLERDQSTLYWVKSERDLETVITIIHAMKYYQQKYRMGITRSNYGTKPCGITDLQLDLDI